MESNISNRKWWDEFASGMTLKGVYDDSRLVCTVGNWSLHSFRGSRSPAPGPGAMFCVSLLQVHQEPKVMELIL